MESTASITADSPADDAEGLLWVQLKRDGNRNARDQLIARYSGLAKAAASRCLRERNYDADLDRGELEQSAMVGLIEAIDRFDASLGIPFPAFAKKRIRGALSDDISRNSEQKAQVSWLRQIHRERIESLDESEQGTPRALEKLAEVAIELALGFMLEDSGMFQPRDERAGPYDSNELAVLQAQLRVVMKELTGPQRRVLELHYFGELSFAEIGKTMKISKVRVFQVHKKAIADLRVHLRMLGRWEELA